MSITAHRRGVLVSVNVGTPQMVSDRGRPTATAIRKMPVDGPVAARGVNLAGDDQADRSVHGGPDKAVYAYSQEDTDWWATELGRSLAPGAFGENLTVLGLPLSEALIGERWYVGSVMLEVAQPRFPCFKLGIQMGSRHFLKRFTAAGRPGVYLRILSEGVLQRGDSVEVVYRPEHDMTIALAAKIRQLDPKQAARLLEIERLPSSWHEWARTLSAR